MTGPVTGPVDGPVDGPVSEPGDHVEGDAGNGPAAGADPRPVRVRVTSPRARAVTAQRVTARSEIDAQTDIGEVYMSSLLRSQLRLAAVVLTALVVPVGGLPLLFALFPGLGRVHVLGVPLPWLVLGVLVYPLLVGFGWWYVRAAERTEHDFAEVVGRR